MHIYIVYIRTIPRTEQKIFILKKKEKEKLRSKKWQKNILQRERIDYLQRNNDKTMDTFLTE